MSEFAQPVGYNHFANFLFGILVFALVLEVASRFSRFLGGLIGQTLGLKSSRKVNRFSGNTIVSDNFVYQV